MILFKASTIQLLDKNDSPIGFVVDFQLKAHVNNVYWQASWTVKKGEDDAKLYHGIVSGVELVGGMLRIRLMEGVHTVKSPTP